MKSHFAYLVAGLWCIANGVLHDVFVIIRHKAGYDRELLRLLLDGHVLLLTGAMLVVSFLLARQGNSLTNILALTAGTLLLSYVMMIMPFLKSFVTLMLSLAVTLIALVSLIKGKPVF